MAYRLAPGASVDSQGLNLTAILPNQGPYRLAGGTFFALDLDRQIVNFQQVLLGVDRYWMRRRMCFGPARGRRRLNVV